MSAPHQPPSDTAATAEATAGAVLSPAPATSPDGPTDLPDRDEASADALVEPADEVDIDGDIAGDTAGGTGTGARTSGTDLLVREGDVAGDYLERLLDILDVDGDIDLDVEGDRASVAIVGGDLRDLVGSDGSVLEALQELTRLAVAQATGVRSRLMLDIGGYRAQRRADLTSLAAEAAQRVAGSRQAERLVPMNPFERKVVHDVIAGVSGVHSESEGEEPNRRVVVLPDR
ncbi:spoIIIJ-associated protein [Geodermatophilus dictyosporus]|uniref:SpoIIIJ-associated protein n=1 Tax=Geodermatophilus dictyosporus TaxID=1523247 RepID=A0A1I5S8N2_9ACTN|nr:protein jag [Geodermatophilus dictyosporus]SFP67104.1 spoIIIJ-associated protein [Geodermatophilus dictyosporus]